METERAMSSKVKLIRKPAESKFREELQSRLLIASKLQKSEERLHAIINASLDSVIVVDEDANILDFNPAAQKLFQYKGQEIVSKSLTLLTQGNDKESAVPWVKRNLNQRIPISMFKKSGKGFPVEVSVVSIPAHGPLLYAIFVKDLTDQKRAEKNLRKYVATIEKINEDLKQFVHIASHDLQEPLRTVASFAQLLEKKYEKQLDSQAEKYIQYIVGGAKHLQELIRSLVEFSRAGRTDFPVEPTDIRTIVDKVIQNLQTRISETGAQFSIGHLPTIEVDPIQITQLFQNIFSNALKFKKAKEPLQIHVDSETSPEGTVFSVSDNGIGFDQEFAEQIFVIFKRLHDRSQYEGTGTGLAICKKIIQRHGGKIWAQSKKGIGSTFYFVIPSEVSTIQFKKEITDEVV